MATYVVLKPFIRVLSVKESYIKLEEEGKKNFLKSEREARTKHYNTLLNSAFH